MHLETAYRMPGLTKGVVQPYQGRGTTVPTAWHCFAKGMAQLCQRRGTILLLIPLLLASCSQDETLPGGSPVAGSMPSLALSTLQATDIDGGKAATRAVTTTDYPTGKSIGFFVKENTTDGYTACNNRKGEYNTTRRLWLPTPDSIWLNNHDADISIYAPYDAAQTTAAALNLAACLRPADGSKDIWCKRFTANNTSKNLAPVLEHVYTRFTITMSLDANYKGTASVDSVALTNDSLYAAAAYRPFETTSYTYTGDAGIEIKLPAVVSLTTAKPTATLDLLLVPATLAADVKLSLTVNGITFGAMLAKAGFAGKLEAGKQYNANIKLKPTALQVTTVTIADWNDEAVSGDKEPAFIDGIDIGLDFNIADGNVRAIKQADGTYLYEFAEDQGYYSGKSSGGAYDPSGGDYFAWNTLDPATIYSTNTSSAWDADSDVCKKVGTEGWYTPTNEQLLTLINAGSVKGTYTTKGGIKVEGRYFGTTTVPLEANQDKYIFLPQAGNRGFGSDSNWRYVGADAYYWSSTVDGATSSYNLFFRNSWDGIKTESSNYRNYGMPVRCVRDK